MLTQRQFMEKVIATSQDQEMVDFAKAFVEKLNKKNATPTKEQLANEQLKEKMFVLFEGDKQLGASAVASAFGVSTQKASALLKQMVDAGKLEKVFDKKGNAMYKAS